MRAHACERAHVWKRARAHSHTHTHSGTQTELYATASELQSAQFTRTKIQGKKTERRKSSEEEDHSELPSCT